MTDLANYHAVMEHFAVYKRFNERWVADPSFREAMGDDPAGALARHRLPVRPEDVRPPRNADMSDASMGTRAMWQIVNAKSRVMHQFYREDGAPADPRIRSWREREIARQGLDLGPFHVRSNIHSSISFELTKGCSVGCWFCALSPDKLTGVFRYDEHRELWRDTLTVFGEALGPALRTGFLYWASDPLDNPDYEKFCRDFHELTGVYPPTTTALALKNPARTRALLAESQERGVWLNRFSIITLKMLDAVHREFTPEELARVECLPVNRESAFAFGNAGRFRDRVDADPALMEQQRRNLQWAPWYTGDPAYADTDDYPLSSIGCVTGFLVNMCDRNVKLISPCTSSDRWPLGYVVYEDAHFRDADELRTIVTRAIDERMSPEVPPGARPRFHDFLRYESLEDGFRLHGRFHTTATFRNAPAWRETGALVSDGELTASAIIERVSSTCGVDPSHVRSQLEGLRQSGVLDELPC